MSALRLVEGDGVLARRGELVLLGRPGDHIDTALATLAAVAADGGDGLALAEQLSNITAAGPVDLVVFGPAAGGLAVAAWGQAWIEVTTEFGEQRLGLRHPSDRVRIQIPGALLSVRAGLGDAATAAAPDRWALLETGVVRAAGLVLEVGATPVRAEPAADINGPRHLHETEELSIVAPGPQPPASPPAVSAPAEVDLGPPSMPEVSTPVAAVDRSQPFSSVLLTATAASGGEAPERAALPIAVRPEAPPEPDQPMPPHPVADDHVEVLGVYCKNGHFDDPAARYCAICGISMVQQTLLPRLGPRPPLGVLVLDDGSIFSLDTDYVIGRDPARDPEVASGAARPLRIDDREGLLSRAHARIHLDGWQVTVIDLGSANGTGLWGPHETGWSQIPRGTPIPIRPGSQVGMGRRQLRYESHRNT